MIFSITRELKNELILADQLFNKSVSSWFDYIDSSWFNFKDDFTFQNISALSIIAYKLNGITHDKMMKMTNIFKMVYVNNNLHGMIVDNHEGQIYNQEMKLKILLGDQILGRVLKLILEAEAEHLLGHFTKMIELINEGLVLEFKMNGSLEEVLKKTKGSVYASIFYSAAKLAEQNEYRTALFEKLGFNLGMAMELCRRGDLEAHRYTAKSKQILASLSFKPSKDYAIISNLINELNEACEPKAVAVI